MYSARNYNNIFKIYLFVVLKIRLRDEIATIKECCRCET